MKRSLAWLLAAILALCGAAHATNYYVDGTSGRDSNPGTRPLPCQSVWACLGKMNPGDSLWVSAGNANGAFACFDIFKSGAPGAPLTVRALGKVVVSPVLGCAGAQASGIYVDAGVHDIVIADFEVAGNAYSGIAATGEGNYNLRLQNNIVHDNGGGGIELVGSDCVQILGNTVYRNSFIQPNSTSGISLYESVQTANCGPAQNGYRNTIAFNEGYLNDNKFPGATDGNCIIIDDMRHTQRLPHVAYLGPTLILSNRCHHNGGRGLHVFNSDNITLQGNTVAHNCLNLTVCPADLNHANGAIDCYACGGVIAVDNTVTPSANEYAVSFAAQSGRPNAADRNRLCAPGRGSHHFDTPVGNVWGAHNYVGLNCPP